MPGQSQGEMVPDPAQGDIDLRQLIRGIGAKKWWIILPTLATLGATFAAVSVIKPRYTAEAKVFLENQESFYTRPEKEQREQSPMLDPEAVQSQVQLITSRDLARQAVAKLKLQDNSEFDTLLSGMDPVGRVMVLLGLAKDPASMAPEERILETYFSKLTVFPVAKTRVLTVEFVSRSPELAAEAANTIADLYLKTQEDAKRTGARNAAGWLLPAIEDLRTRVLQAEAQVADFRSRSNLLVGNNNTTISSQQMSELNTQLSNARAAQSESQAKSQRLAELMRQGRVFEVSDVVKDDLIRRISEQRVTLKAQLALEARTLLPGHPRMKELQAQLADVDGEMRRAAEKVGHALEGDSKVAAARVRSIEASLEAQKKVASTGNGEDVQLRAYEREAKSARDQLESYLAKYREASARDGINASPADARIISRAVAPQLPSFPKKIPMLLISGLGALFLSTGLVVARLLLSGGASEALRPVARREEEGEAMDATSARPVVAAVAPAETVAANLPPVAAPGRLTTPSAPLEIRARAERVVACDDPSGADTSPTARLAGLARVICRLSQNEGPDTHGLCILVTGLERASGATSTAIGLARLLAQGKKAVIVDLDLAMPGLDTLVVDDGSGEAPVGLADILANTASVAAALHRDEISSLHVMPAGGTMLDDAVPLQDITRAIAALRQAYDYVILDAAAVPAQPETLDFARFARAVVIVAPDPEASADDIVALLQKLPASDICESLIYTPAPEKLAMEKVA